MKKVTLFVLSLFCLFGCVKQQVVDENKDFELYTQLKDRLLSQTSFDSQYPFSVQIVYNELEDQYRYDIIIDNVQVDMYNIIALAYADESDEEMCPTIGIFDEEKFNLKVGFVDKANHFYKGIQLSGTIQDKQTIKLYVRYHPIENQSDYEEKFIEVKNEIR